MDGIRCIDKQINKYRNASTKLPSFLMIFTMALRGQSFMQIELFHVIPNELHATLNELHATPNELYATPNKLHATSNELHATPNKFHTTPNLFHATPKLFHAIRNNTFWSAFYSCCQFLKTWTGM